MKKPSAKKKAARTSSARRKVASRDAGEHGEEKRSAEKRSSKRKAAFAAAANSGKARARKGAARKKTAGRTSGLHPAEDRTGIWCEEPVCEDAVESASQKIRMEMAKRKVKGSVPAIVEAMIKKAKAGNYSHAKALLEMAGARLMFAEEAPAGAVGESWAKRVLERIEEAERTERQEPPPNEAGTGPQA